MMLTAAEFEVAAFEFAAVSDELHGLGAAVRSIDVRAVLQGGLLGQTVPERMTACADRASIASARAEAAAQVCRERAAILRAYEAKVAAYHAAMAIYEVELAAYNGAASAWYSVSVAPGEYMLVAPVVGPPPARPASPGPPPAWADVGGPR